MKSRVSWIAALLAICAGVAVLAAVWPRSQPVLYIHVYSNRYDIESMGDLPPHPRPWQRIATLSVASGSPFFAQFPGHYEPRLQFDGIVRKRGDVAIGNFSIEVEDVGTTLGHKQEAPIPLGVVFPLACEGCAEEQIEFRFCISDSPEGDRFLPKIKGD